MQEKIILFGFVALAGLFAFVCLWLSAVFRAKATIKDSVYECGIEPIGDANVPYSVKYVIFAMLFLLFDIETILLFPFAAAFSLMGTFALFEIILFGLILTFALLYAIKTGMLKQ